MQREGSLLNYELSFRIKSGLLKHCQLSSELIEINGVTCLLSSVVDISSQKELEEKFFNTELRWQFAVEGSGLGLWDWNPQTNDVYFSTQWKQMLGFEDDEISNTLEEWDKRVHPEDKDQVYRDIQKHMSGETAIYENLHRVLCKSGEYKWIMDRGKVMEWTDDGKPLRMIGTHADLTERKQTEIELGILNSTKDKLFSVIAHDLRSPIATIMQLSDYVSSSGEELDISTLKSLLVSQKELSSNTLLLLENLLSWARLNQDEIVMNPGPLQLSVYVASILDTLKHQAELKRIRVCLDLPEKDFVWVDADIFTIVIRNLLINAIKFTMPGGKITVSSHTNGDVTTSIAIQDSGVGMNEEAMAQILSVDEFHSTFGTSNEKGSGLGLKLVKGFIECSDGFLDVKSQIGQGSCFTVFLPSHSPEACLSGN